MDPFLVLLHSVSTGLSDDELTELKFLCRGRVGKRKLESVRCGLDLFAVLLEQNELDAEHTELLRELLVSLRRQDLLQRLDGFEAGAAGRAPPEERELRAAFDIVCDNVGRDWRRLARHLKVTDAKIDAIEEKYPRNLTEQVRESLRVWQSAGREDATVSHLVSALRACQLNLVADLVLEGQQAQENESKTARSAGTETDSGPKRPSLSRSSVRLRMERSWYGLKRKAAQPSGSPEAPGGYEASSSPRPPSVQTVWMYSVARKSGCEGAL